MHSNAGCKSFFRMGDDVSDTKIKKEKKPCSSAKASLPFIIITVSSSYTYILNDVRIKMYFVPTIPTDCSALCAPAILKTFEIRKELT